MFFHDESHKTINLEICNWPVAITGDGFPVNTAAGDDLASKFGQISPNLICGSHAANGSLKRMANSKTMNVGAVTKFLPCFEKIIKHFKLSGKSTCALKRNIESLGDEEGAHDFILPHKNGISIICMLPSGSSLSPN